MTIQITVHRKETLRIDGFMVFIKCRFLETSDLSRKPVNFKSKFNLLNEMSIVFKYVDKINSFFEASLYLKFLFG